MSEYDGSVRIGTEIDTKKLDKNIATLENKLLKTAEKARQLQHELDGIGSKRVASDEFIQIEKDMESLLKKYDALDYRKRKFLATGGDEKSRTFQGMIYELEYLRDQYAGLEEAKKEMIASGKDTASATETAEYRKKSNALAQLTAQVVEYQLKIQQMQSVKSDQEELQNQRDLSQEIENTGEKLDEISAKSRKAGSEMKKSANTGRKAFDKLGKTLKKIGLMIVGVRSVRALFMKMRSALVDTLPALQKYDSEFNGLMESMNQSSAKLKGSFASAFSQIAMAVIPVLTKVASAITMVVDKFTQLFAYLRGAKTWQKVVGGAISSVGDSAKKASKSLAAFDELNVLNKNDSGASGADSGVEFEELPIDVEMVEELKAKLSELIPIILGVVLAVNFLKLALSAGWELTTIVGLMMAFIGLIAMIQGIRDAWENGLDWGNMTKIIAGATFVVAGLGLAFGAVAATIGAVIAGIAMVVVGIHDILENGVNLQNSIMVIIGVATVLFALFGAGIALIGALVAAIVLAIIADWDNFKTYILKMWVQVQQAFQKAFDAIFGRFKEFGQKMAEGWDKLWNGDFLGALKLFGEGFESLLAGIINTVIFMVNGALAAISMIVVSLCAGLNAIINAINSIDVKIPDWVPIFGGKQFSPNIPRIPDFTLPQIPYLATGTVVPANYGEFAAILGDNKKEPEIVSPLSTMREAMIDALSEVGFGGEIVINADADMAALIKLLNLKLADENNRIGRNMNKVVHVNG